MKQGKTIYGYQLFAATDAYPKCVRMLWDKV